MKHSLAVKAIAIALAAIALGAAVAGALGIIALSEAGLYNRTVEELQQSKMESITYEVAASLAEEYIEDNLSNATEAMLRSSSYYSGEYSYYWYEFNNWLGENGWYYTLSDADGKLLLSGGGRQEDWSDYTLYEHQVSMNYPRLVAVRETPNQDEIPELDSDDVTTPVGMMDGPTATYETVVSANLYEDCYTWYDEETGRFYDYYLAWENSPEYTVKIYLPKDFRTGYTEGYWRLMTLLRNVRYALLPCLLAGAAVFVAAMVYLVLAAGRSRRSDAVQPGGLNCLPLDLYTVIAIGGSILLGMGSFMLLEWTLSMDADAFNWGMPVLTVLPYLAAAVLVVGYFFALAAQFKAGNGYWWRRSVIGWCLRMLYRGLRMMMRGLQRLFSMLSVTWQWAVTAGALGLSLLLVGLCMAETGHPFFVLLFLFILLICGIVVAYGAYAFAVLLSGARRMAQGDLNKKIPSKFLIGCFADCAKQLNALADVAVEAAKNQLKSDRMKTELITNVSHDIKTPLTSIINYVDLLRKPHTEQQGEEYLAVLARQSGQMKKLIEDLMDMSKATTGNMAVEIAEMDAVEAVNQALGEFSDKLAAVPLVPVVRHPDEPVMIRADGRLVWRTLSNLLHNAVKYALPGTRLYVDIARVEGNVIISLKNISREELNISADELMERFVRGDASRNTEGSGLGLNIAKSLMELQRGQLRLLVDGDLFKTSMIFPSAD